MIIERGIEEMSMITEPLNDGVIKQTPDESKSLRKNIRDFLLRLRFLALGINFLIIGIFFCMISLNSVKVAKISNETMAFWGGFMIAGFISFIALDVIVRFYAPKFDLRAVKTLGYEDDAEIFRQLSMKAIKRESLMFQIPLYLSAIILLPMLIGLFWSGSNYLLYMLTLGIYFVIVPGLQNLYLAATGNFYLLPEFQPGEKKNLRIDGDEKSL